VTQKYNNYQAHHGPDEPLQGGGVLEQPQPPPISTPKAGGGGGSVLPNDGGVLEQQQQPDEGTTQTGNDNNQPSLKHKAKHSEDGGGNLDLPQTGELRTKKGGNNEFTNSSCMSR
jgi:hypothetical protein